MKNVAIINNKTGPSVTIIAICVWRLCDTFSFWGRRLGFFTWLIPLSYIFDFWPIYFYDAFVMAGSPFILYTFWLHVFLSLLFPIVVHSPLSMPSHHNVSFISIYPTFHLLLVYYIFYYNNSTTSIIYPDKWITI